jgi:hypothetical protein
LLSVAVVLALLQPAAAPGNRADALLRTEHPSGKNGLAKGVQGPRLAPASYEPPAELPELRPAILETRDGSPSARTRRTGSRSKAGSEQVQLGAWRAEADAAYGWNRIVAGSGDLLTGLSPRIVGADIPGKGRYWRLRTAPGPGQSASALCDGLKARGIACIPVK